LVSPFVAYIDIDEIIRDNTSCGNVVKGLKWGFDNIEDTLRNDKASCFNTTEIFIRSPIRFTFAYQSGKWIFKNVFFVKVGEKESFDEIMSVLGMPSRKFSEITEPEGVSYNKKWKDLIK